MPESFAFGVPAITDANDGSTLYVMGTEFSTSADGSWTGVTWRVPNSVAVNNHYILAYLKTGANTGNFLGSKLFTPVPGGMQTVLFNTPFAVVAGSSYVACVLTNHYVATTSYGWPVASAHMTAPSGSNGRLVSTSADSEKFPSTVSGTANNFFVSPVVVYTQTVAIGTATETDAAFALGRAKTRMAGTATESGTAIAFGRSKVRALGLAVETDIALAFDTGLHGPVGARIVSTTRPGRIVSTARPGRIVIFASRGRIVSGGGA